jgi:hypothetical protein
MSSKAPVKKISSPRATSPKAKKKKCVKNTFELVQFKKMIGKGLVIAYKGTTAQFDASIKDKIMSGSVKSIGLSGFVSSGIIHIFDGVDRLLAIHAVSYAEIKKAKLEIDIFVNQYSSLTPLDLI